MKNLFQSLLGCLGIKPKRQLLSPDEFTERFLAELRARAPDLELRVVKPLELQMKRKDGDWSDAFLDNAYNTYAGNPEALEGLLQQYAKAHSEAAAAVEHPIDVNRIVPIIKDAGWLQENLATMTARGMDTEKFAPVFEPYNSQLTIFYAEDTAQNIRYLTMDNLTEAKLERNDLKRLAADNLRFLLPEIKVEGGDGRYRVTAGGDYDASLLLMDGLWTGGEIGVDGDYVVAVPARDVLLVGGSNDKKGVAWLQDFAAKVANEASYRLTSKLFVYRQGKFEVFDG